VTGEIRELYAYNRWANRRLLGAAGDLSPADFDRDLGSSFPSVRSTLAHILAGEWIWLQRWLGRSPQSLPSDREFASYPALRSRWSLNEEAQLAFIDGLGDDSLRSTVRYRTTEGDTYEAPLWQLMRHVVNHSTYHRGQVATMLRQLGATAPATDLVVFHRERPS
jgi:uncharacterized damage-inducible protein DinB